MMYKHILHATDFSENHFDLCTQAVEIAKAFHAKLYLLHVIHPPASLQLAQGLGFAEYEPPNKEDAVAVMRVLGEALKIPTKQQFVDIGSIKLQILSRAKELGCELIIIGSHTPSSFPPFLGSTAHAITHHAQCDVLTIRA